MKKTSFIVLVFFGLGFLISFGGFATSAHAGIDREASLIEPSSHLFEPIVHKVKKDTATSEVSEPIKVAVPLEELDAISGPTVLVKDATGSTKQAPDSKEGKTVKKVAKQADAPAEEPSKRSQRVDESFRPFPVIM